MSLFGISTGVIPTGLPVAFAAAEALISPILIRSRIIGPFVADVTLEETHVDQLDISDNPVEQGASVTDNAYKRAMRVQIRAGWSNSSNQAGGYPSYIQAIYNAFILLQASRQPFEIITGKRLYVNMLAETITERTDKDYENGMILVIDCREIILVQTQTLTVPNASVMANPSSNAATQSLGTVSAAPAGSAFNTTAGTAAGVGTT